MKFSPDDYLRGVDDELRMEGAFHTFEDFQVRKFVEERTRCSYERRR